VHVPWGGVVDARLLPEQQQVILDVDLSWNRVRDKGVAALAQGLAINTALQRLVLCSNSLHEAGARSLALALQTNTKLEVLDVRHNDLGRAGVASLSAAASETDGRCQLLLHSVATQTPGGREARTKVEQQLAQLKMEL
jgi:Ran GTPase-activating protein (RanGAP) involved in mRNA processing and transport